MSERKHNPTIRGAAAPVLGSDIIEFVRRLSPEPVYVDVTFTAAQFAISRHGLGRRYIGAFVVGVSASHDRNLIAFTPEACSSAGYDPAVWVYVDSGAKNYTGTVRLRVL